MDYRTSIRDYILTNFLKGESPENLLDDSPLAGILTSLSVLKLVSFIEQLAKIEISAEDAGAHFRTVDTIVAYLAARTGDQ